MGTAARKNRYFAPIIYRKVLLDKRAEFLEALGVNLRELAEPEQRLGEDPGKVALEEFVHLRVNGVLYGQLREVEDALERLHGGEYGICLGCGSAIPERRLAAIPWAGYCVACQEHTAPLPVEEGAEVGKEQYPC